MPDLVPVDVYTDGAVLDTANYNLGMYSATAAQGRYSVLNGQIEAANIKSGFLAPRRLLQPMQGPVGYNSSGRRTQQFYNDYTVSADINQRFTVHGITLEFDVPRAYDLCMWQMGFYASHWRGFVKGDQEATVRGPVQPIRSYLYLNGSALGWTERGYGADAIIDQTATVSDLEVRERIHQRYMHISHMQTSLPAGRHYLDLRVYMEGSVIPDETEIKIADNEYDVDVNYYSRLTFGLHNVCVVAM